MKFSTDSDPPEDSADKQKSVAPDSDKKTSSLLSALKLTDRKDPRRAKPKLGTNEKSYLLNIMMLLKSKTNNQSSLS